MQFELHLLKPIRDIRIIHALHENRPRMRMIEGRAIGLRIRNRIERLRYSAKYEWPIYLNPLHALLGVRRRHVGMRLEKVAVDLNIAI